MSLLREAYYAGGAAWATATERWPVGRSIYDADVDWDICLVLDSARVDLFRQALAAMPRDATADAVWSRGSNTTEWLTQTFRRDAASHVAETTFLSANPHTQTVFDERAWLTNPDEVRTPFPASPAVERDGFRRVDDLWRTHASVAGAVPADVMAAATINAYRRDGRRVVAHWMQPHEPFIAPTARVKGGAAIEKNVWRDLAAGRLDRADVWQSYRANHAYALHWVDTVLRSVDGRVLVTSDHGNLFGELGQFGHPFGMVHPAVRKVPWLLVDATAEWDPDVETMLADAAEQADRDAQLRALGYLD